MQTNRARATSEFVKRQLSDREVQRWKCYAVAGSQAKPEENLFSLDVSDVVANGSVASENQFIQVAFQGGQSTYEFRVSLSESFFGNGVGARFRLRCWQTLRYVAIGYTQKSHVVKAFRHVKIANAAQDKWTDFSIGHQDIAFGLQNDWQHPPATEISDIRIYLSGTPGNSGAWLDVDSCWLWQETESPPVWVTDGLAAVPVSDS